MNEVGRKAKNIFEKDILFYKERKKSQFSIAALFFNGTLLMAAKEYGTRTIILSEGLGEKGKG